VPDKDLFVREYTFTNTGTSSCTFSFLLYSSFTMGENPLYNTTLFEPSEDALVHYKQQHYFAWAGALPCAKFQSGLSFTDVQTGVHALTGSLIDMQPGGALSWRVDQLAPGDAVVIPVYLAAGHHLHEVLKAVNEAKEKTSDEWYQETVAYWQTYLSEATPCPIEEQEIRELYERSLLMFKLMSDEKTGSIIAAPEFDEYYVRCGGYGYCWGRDAAFITTALDRAGLVRLTDRFYEWTLTAQSPDGSWQQRHYHDGSLAPSWGLQIDEGASIIWGMYQHYLHTRDDGFAEKIWPAARQGAEFLLRYLDDETGLPKPSKDLWEEREASHIYSSAAVCSGLRAAAEFATLAGEDEFAAACSKAAQRIADAIQERCWNESRGSLYRGLRLTVSEEEYAKHMANGARGDVVELDKGYKRYVLDVDPVIDISLLGVAVPFDVLPADSREMRKTADAVEEMLTVPGIGGIKRYENDPYIGGNPWILTTCWLAQYRIAIGELDAARELIRWTVEHRTHTGLLPEQVDKETGDTAWVVPLTWSHAMFVLAVWMLAEAEREAEVGAGTL
jgi:oligosaccharide amylase